MISAFVFHRIVPCVAILLSVEYVATIAKRFPLTRLGIESVLKIFLCRFKKNSFFFVFKPSSRVILSL